MRMINITIIFALFTLFVYGTESCNPKVARLSWQRLVKGRLIIICVITAIILIQLIFKLPRN